MLFGEDFDKNCLSYTQYGICKQCNRGYQLIVNNCTKIENPIPYCLK